MQRRGGANLIAAAVHVDSFKSRVQRQTFRIVTLNQLSLYRPLLRCLCILKHFAESVNEYETGYVLGVSARTESDD
jgi:hypothetical protein